jgi:hypothetical protein
VDTKPVTRGKRLRTMSGESLNTAGGDRSYSREHAKSVFCEKLLECCVCGKIYFSRQPISLLTLSPKNFHVCTACVRMLKCSICGIHVSPKATLVVENPPDVPLVFLCHSCRNKMLISSSTSLFGIPKKLRKKAATVLGNSLALLQKIVRLQVWPFRGRR